MVGLVAPAQSARRGPARTLTLALALASICLAAAGPAEAQRPRAGALPERELLPAASDPRPEKPPALAATASAPTPLLPPYVDAARSFFDGTVLHDIQITMKPGDWETLKANYMTDTYYPADFQWRGVKVPMIGIRSRGNVSRNPRKPSLRLDFNRYLTEQKFLKLSALVLANAVQDATMLNNRLAMMVFSALELPAPRVVHARLFVNGEYVGLYQAVEAIEKAFLARAFGFDSKGKRRDDGYLFEYRWVQGWHWTYLGPDPASYASMFEVKTHELEAPSVLYGPIEDMFRAINEASDADFEAEVGRYLNLPVFIRHLAVERFLADIDGYLADWGPNNIYLYRFENSTLSAVIPWDADVTFWNAWYEERDFGGLNEDIYRAFTRTVLTQRIIESPALHRLYLECLLDCATTVGQPDAPGSPVSWLEAEALRQRAQIEEAAKADPTKPYGNDTIDQAQARLLEFVRNRSAVVQGKVQTALQQLARQVR